MVTTVKDWDIWGVVVDCIITIHFNGISSVLKDFTCFEKNPISLGSIDEILFLNSYETIKCGHLSCWISERDYAP